VRGRKPSWIACWVKENAPEMIACDAMTVASAKRLSSNSNEYHGKEIALLMTLRAKTAKKARTEIMQRWPHVAVNYTGYDRHGEAVIMSLVRKRGDKANVATTGKVRSN
jgi:hypothetical protein